MKHSRSVSIFIILAPLSNIGEGGAGDLGDTMRHHCRPLAAGLAVFLVAALAASQSAIAAPPVEAFGNLPVMQTVEVSPDGTHFAAIRTMNGEKSLLVYDLYGKRGERSRAMSFDGEKQLQEELRRVFWANDTRLVAVVEIPTRRWGVDVMETRMVAMDNDLGAQQVIPKVKNPIKPKAGNRSIVPTQLQDRVLHILPEDSEHILIELDKEGRGHELGVYKLDVYSGGLRKVPTDEKLRVGGFVADVEGKVRIRYRYRPEEEDFVTQYRADIGSRWTSILEDEADGLGDWTFEAFKADSTNLYIMGPGDHGRDEIRVYDPLDPASTSTIFYNDAYDISGVVVDERSNRVIGSEFLDDDARVAYIDSVWRRTQSQLDALLPGKVNRLVSRDKEGETWSVLSGGQGEPGTWYLYFPDRKQLSEIGRTYPELQGHALRPVTAYSYTARDGLVIPGYLTKPEGEGPFPTVILPHGGPNARDTMAFDYQVQFLASRGYAVLQPNFRGSTGYGVEFEMAGHGQWGLAMQDDLTDGTKALVNDGIAAPDRICIIGSSYGGYAALMGVVREPDLYKCAASFGGVSNVKSLLGYWSKFKFRTDNDPRIGDRWKDGERLRDTSPVNNADAIKVPVLIMHGKNDRRVPVEQSKDMAKQLKKLRKPHKLVIFKEGDHHLSLEQDRIRYLRELETFLDQHIGD